MIFKICDFQGGEKTIIDPMSGLPDLAFSLGRFFGATFLCLGFFLGFFCQLGMKY